MHTSDSNIIIVHVPYGSHQTGEGLALNDNEKYESDFRYALTSLTNSQNTSSSYVYPKRPNLQEKEAERNYYVLTESPVVYIVVFNVSEEMKTSRWLEEALRGNSSNTTNLNQIKYVIYIGETNDILRRTNQHLTVSGQIGGFVSTETYENLYKEVDERTGADQIIQRAVNDGIAVCQYVIWNTFFTKSMTLDIEHKFIDYSWALDDVLTLNRRGNAQRNYYKSEEKDLVCSEVWQELSRDDPKLFPPEHDIWNSELYKVSPFHSLGEEQSAAVNEICLSAAALVEGNPICGEKLDSSTSSHRLIIVEGASGTGKSIVLSTLFVRLSEALRDRSADENDYSIKPNNRVCLVVNQDQQLALYTNLAKKVGLTRTNKDADTCVYKATPFLNAVEKGKRNQPDIVLVDEAHLLRMKPGQAYPKKYHGNQLYDILLRANVVIAVFDPVQVMRANQQWDPDMLAALLSNDIPRNGNGGRLTYSKAIKLTSNGDAFPGSDTFNCYHIKLTEQFRIDAGREIIEWIDRLANLDAEGISPIPEDTKKRSQKNKNAYDLRIFSSPSLLAEAIDKRRQESEAKSRDVAKRFGAPLCRLLATYDWAYNTNTGEGFVTLYRIPDKNGKRIWSMPEGNKPPANFSGNEDDLFSRHWNYSKSKNDGKSVWTSNKAADKEVGSYFSVQGFDLNYAGIIIGPSIKYRNNHIVIDTSKSKDGQVSGKYADDLVIQQFRVLLRRGIYGLYLFAVDPELQTALEKAAQSSGKLDI